MRLQGDAYQRGLQCGQALMPQLRALRRTFHDDVLFRRGWFLGWSAYSLMRVLAACMEQHTPRSFLDEVRGVADGAGIPYGDVLLMTCFDDVIHNLQFAVPVGRLACSAVAVQGRRAPGGGVLLARNLDYYPEADWWGVGALINRILRETVTLFVVRPTHGHAFVSIGWPGFVGVVTGLNDAGLAVACLTSTVPTETADGVPAPLIYRRMLEEAETLAECEAILRATRRTIGNNVLVVSARDNAACVFEFTPRLVAPRKPLDDLLAVTNHFQHPATATEQAGWRLPNSIIRLERLQVLCASGSVDPLGAQRILSDAVADGDCTCICNPGTIYSVVVDPHAMRLWLCCRDAPGRAFCSLDVGHLLRP
ncbi:MAG: hypothetical protein HY690_05620 [Chloroflexi bacterium]|nr:hypothetical protein [Chloroflexota bacterium]